jgi:3-oxoacyl-[acyl-carrier-protein] synthase II
VKAPGGLTPDELWTSVCAGRSLAARFVDDRLDESTAMLACEVGGFDPSDYLSGLEQRRTDRCQQLAVGAAQDALVGVTRLDPVRCAVVVGVGLGASGTYETQFGNLWQHGPRGVNPLTVPMIMPSSAAALLSLRFGFRGPALTVSAACASGAMAIGEAVELLRRGAADLVLVGGVESLVTYAAMCSFLRLDAMSRNIGDPAHASRPFDVDRDGFVLGEGAGFVVLCREADATSAIGRIVGYGTCSDAYHLVAPSPDGEGALRCMRLALADADVDPVDIVHVNAHGTSTRLNDLAEARAISSLFGERRVPVTSAKGTTGHLIAGSGAVETILTLWTLRKKIVPPVAGLRRVDPDLEPLDVVCRAPRPIADGPALTNSFGFGGVNASLVVMAPSGD